MTGDPYIEVLKHYQHKTDDQAPLARLNLAAGEYFLATTHREENVDNPDHLNKILDVLNSLAEIYKYPVIVSMHPRTKKRLKNIKNLSMNPLIQFLKPFGCGVPQRIFLAPLG